jgi:segregation and condensation protein B
MSDDMMDNNLAHNDALDIEEELVLSASDDVAITEPQSDGDDSYELAGRDEDTSEMFEASDDDSIEEEPEPAEIEVTDELAEQNEQALREMSPEDQLRALEAILFATNEPMTPNMLRERMPEGADVGGMLLALREEYAVRGVNLVEKDGYWAFRTSTDLADVMRIKKEVQRKLSRSAMETLAIVAYHQPVTRAEIENIRGVVTNKGTLDILMEVGWIRPGRRRETPGRPLTWVTTNSFMDHFGLSSLMDLPGLDELKSSGLLDRRPAIETIGGTGDLFGDNDSEDLKKAAQDIAKDQGLDQDEERVLPSDAYLDKGDDVENDAPMSEGHDEDDDSEGDDNITHLSASAPLEDDEYQEYFEDDKE